MKKLILLLTFLSIASIMFAQVSKTVNLANAGTLSTSISLNELNTITNLTLTGNIDARDFKTMREEMSFLEVLDLSEVKIAAYDGIGGSNPYGNNYLSDVIPFYAFLNPNTGQSKKSLISVILPSSIISIGDWAFAGCTGLTNVTIPSSVTSIGDDAFWGCSGLTTVNIPSSVTSIGFGAFWKCTALTTITIPSSVATIKYATFSGCTGLTSVTIPSSVTIIEKNAFAGCSALTTLTIPSSVTSIGEYAFSGCSALTNIPIPSSVTSIGFSAFSFCTKLTTIVIPSSVTSIGESAFYKCSALTNVTIPSSVTFIRKSTFAYCSGLTTVSIPSSVTTIGENAFDRCSKLVTVSIPSSVTTIGDEAFFGCSALTTVNIPSSVASIRKYAFFGCSGLTSITTSRITPVDLSGSPGVFMEINKTTCTLYVPLGSKSAYQTAPQWKDFTNIIEKDLTVTSPEINDQTLTIYPNPTTGKIRVVFDQIPQRGTTLTVNDFTGKTILTQFIQNKEEQIDLEGNPPGVYLIRTKMKDFKVQKVILK